MPSRHIRKPFMWILLAMPLVVTACGGPAQPNITASFQGQSSYRRGEAVKVTFNLANASPADLYVLKWGTPFEGFRSMFYLVEKDGQKLTYKGRTATRGTPTRDDYFKIAFGEVTQITLDLTEAFDLSQPGSYTLKLATNILDYAWKEEDIPRSADEHVSYTLVADPFPFKIE